MPTESSTIFSLSSHLNRISVVIVYCPSGSPYTAVEDRQRFRRCPRKDWRSLQREYLSTTPPKFADNTAMKMQSTIFVVGLFSGRGLKKTKDFFNSISRINVSPWKDILTLDWIVECRGRRRRGRTRGGSRSGCTWSGTQCSPSATFYTRRRKLLNLYKNPDLGLIREKNSDPGGKNTIPELDLF